MKKYLVALILLPTAAVIWWIVVYNTKFVDNVVDKPVAFKVLEVPVMIDDDPLDNNVEGFPHKPLNYKTADLCNKDTNIILARSWHCNEDTTCVKCRSRQIKRYEEITKNFIPEMKKVDLSRYSKELPITVMAVNTGQVYLFLNWACSIQHYQIGKPEDLTFVVPTDKKAYEQLKPFRFNMIDPDDWMSKLSNRIGRSYNPHLANVGGHADINNVLLIASNFILQNTKYDVLLHDVDQVWIKEGPLPFFNRVKARRDILGMASPYGHAGGGTNSGLIYFHNTAKSRIFLQSVTNVAGLKKHSDQTLFNTMFRHHSFHTLSINHVTEEILTRYSGSRHTKVNEKTVLFHAVSVNKERNFKKYGYWFLGDNCTFKI